MSHFTNSLRAATVAVLVGGSGYLGAATATADPDTGNPEDVNTLAGALSKGYDLNDCTPQQLNGAELAALSCGQSPDPNGPPAARYVLFGNASDLAAAFKGSIKEEAQTACGESGESPTSWRIGATGSPAGQVACGTYQNVAEIIWTIDSKNVLSYIRGSNADVGSLYEWWRQNG